MLDNFNSCVSVSLVLMFLLVLSHSFVLLLHLLSTCAATGLERITYKKYLRPWMFFFFFQRGLAFAPPWSGDTSRPNTAQSFLNHSDGINLKDKSLWGPTNPPYSKDMALLSFRLWSSAKYPSLGTFLLKLPEISISMWRNI